MKFVMKKIYIVGLYISLAIFSQAHAQNPQNDQGSDSAQYRNLLNKYCVSCHNETLKTAGVMLDMADIGNVSENPELWERVITKLTLRAMPPVGMPVRPSEGEYKDVLNYLITELDNYAINHPNPGRPTIHRLNRTEYQNAIRDMLALEINSEDILPPDNVGYGFDNIAEILTTSPVLMERYLFAAGRVSRLAVGPASMNPNSVTYTIPDTYRQDALMSEELPLRSRGGTAIHHYFPLDGEYTIKIDLSKTNEGYIRGLREEHLIDIRLDHKRIGTLTVGGEVHGRTGPIFTGNQNILYAGELEQVGYEFTADKDLLIRFPTNAGMHLVGVTFVDEHSKPTGIQQPELVLANMLDYKGGRPAIESVIITGPYATKGPGHTDSMEKIFVCRPSSSNDETCAREILSGLARKAYRRPVNGADLDELMALYRTGMEETGFEGGIELALESILVGPEFLFRIAEDPPGAKPGDVYPISDIDLASRLSFFLWSSIPDDELLQIAESGKLREPGVLESQVTRMIADPRFDAFINNFGGQWLGMRNLNNSEPNPDIYLEFDEELRHAFKQELLLWFAGMVREDQSIVEILNSDYTYVNERLARHYGIPAIYGTRFRSVKLDNYPERRGLFGKGGFLQATAFNNRTSPVIRGKWVLENLLHMPPPPPPDAVPALRVEDDSGKTLTLKQAMEKHRANPVCASCHKLMDPIGFALENFDAVGSYRDRYVEADADVDASGILFDGSPFSNPDEFKQEFMQHSDRVAQTIAEKVLMYALGRGLGYYDHPAVRKIVERMAPGGYKWSALLLEVIKSTPFQYRRVSHHGDI